MLQHHKLCTFKADDAVVFQQLLSRHIAAANADAA